MFGRTNVVELLSTIKRLKAEIQKLKEESEELKFKKKMELKEVEHLVKMAKEKNAIEFEKKVAEIQDFLDLLGVPPKGEGESDDYIITTREEYDALPNGTSFIDSKDGKSYTKPGEKEEKTYWSNGKRYIYDESRANDPETKGWILDE